ncbi:MAG: hypothetical protein ABSB18_03500 [Candidatus Omnitrophota bacterium]
MQRLDLFILIILVLAALWTAMSRGLIRSAIGLALTSAILTIIMFRLNSPLAAVFELSVCSGLISVLFVSTISLTQPLTKEEARQHMWARLSRFWYLPIILVGVGIFLSLFKLRQDLSMPVLQAQKDVRVLLWGTRQMDLLGQLLILLAGVFAVIILFKEKKNNE